MSSNCLGFLDNELYWEAAGNWMVDFGKMNTQEKQWVVIEKILEKIQHADSLADCVDAASQDPKKHIIFCLPLIMTDVPEDSILNNDARVVAIQALHQYTKYPKAH
jgi:hypothetical protein